MANVFIVKLVGVAEGTTNLNITAKADGYESNKLTIPLTITAQPITELTSDTSEVNPLYWGPEAEPIEIEIETNATNKGGTPEVTAEVEDETYAKVEDLTEKDEEDS